MEVTPFAQLEKQSKGRAQIRCCRAVTEDQRRASDARTFLVELCSRILFRVGCGDLGLPSVNRPLTILVRNA